MHARVNQALLHERLGFVFQSSRSMIKTSTGGSPQDNTLATRPLQIAFIMRWAS